MNTVNTTFEIKVKQVSLRITVVVLSNFKIICFFVTSELSLESIKIPITTFLCCKNPTATTAVQNMDDRLTVVNENTTNGFVLIPV